jgi:alpha-amylase
MGVLMQAFYWNCPREESKEKQWWPFVATKLPELKNAGFTALWLPPASKAANIGEMSMGYDVYDYWDLGKYNQKGSVETLFGSESALQSLIQSAHDHHMQVYADLVLNHCNGADAKEFNPMIGAERWTKFTPLSGKFSRDWTCFNPSPYTLGDVLVFGTMPDLCHINPRVSTNILNLAKWMIESIGYDGFRYDFVKGFASWIIRAIHDRTYHREGHTINIFGVGECWDGDTSISDWLDSLNSWATHKVTAFDFPLRYRLKEMCDSSDFNMRRLLEGDVLVKDRPMDAVTFVDNHDFRGVDGGDEIINDKILAYAYILTHEGYPCVFWKDYFKYGLAKPKQKNGIEALVKVHEQYAGGTTVNLGCDERFYAMERTGAGNQSGLVFAMNNAGEMLTRTVKTGFAGRPLYPAAWSDRTDSFIPPPCLTPDDNGRCDITVGPRGFVVWAP